MLEKNEISQLLDEFVQNGHASTYYFACGNLNQNGNSLEISSPTDKVFDLSSLTKALVTTPLLFSLQRKGLLQIDGRLDQLPIPEPLAHLGAIPIAEILRHQSGLPAWRNFYVHCHSESDLSITERTIARLARIKVNPKMRGVDCYSDVGMILLWVCLTQHLKRSVQEMLSQHVYQDIGYRVSGDFGYADQISKGASFASCGPCVLRGRDIIGEVQDENCWALGGASFHAGLFGSGKALSSYLLALTRSELGKDLLQRNYAFVAPGNPSLLGWRQANDPANAGFGGGRAMGHLGFTGTAFWVDFDKQRFVILLTNRLIAGRTPAAIRALRTAVFAKAGADE